MRVIRHSVLFVFILFVQNPKVLAFLAGRPLEVSYEFILNPVKGNTQRTCQNSEEIQAYSKKSWWVSFGQAIPHSKQEGWEIVTGEISCGEGVFDDVINAQNRNAFLITEGTTVVRINKHMEDERSVFVEISFTMQKLFGFDRGGNPVYEASNVKREFYFSDNHDAFVPIFLASADERDELGINEILMRVSVRVREKESDAVYGIISVISGGGDSEVLLDGGVIRKISGSKETIVKNVPVGLHIVGVRDSSGEVIRKTVRVEANRTVLVDLSPGNLQEIDTQYRLTSLGKNTRGYDEYRRVIDGAVVVKIPSGEFLMGNKETERTPLEHQVYVSEFLMDKTGITWGQYKKFVMETRIPLPLHNPYWGIHDDHPVVYVTWEDAKAYCEWAGGRLPTEAEREKAARGIDGRKYPWGNEEPNPERGVFRRHWGRDATAAVGTHPAGASPYGLQDMGGNVWEWCSDWYDKDYYEVSPYKDPKGPASGIAHVVRGGSWDSRPTVLSASCRSWGHRGYRDGDFGFRCAMNSP